MKVKSLNNCLGIFSAGYIYEAEPNEDGSFSIIDNYGISCQASPNLTFEWSDSRGNVYVAWFSVFEG